MMTPVQNAWTVVVRPVRAPAEQLHLSPRQRNALRAQLVAAVENGHTVEMDPSLVLKLLDRADPQSGRVVDYEVTIVDDDRAVQYAARVNDRGDLSWLEVRAEGQWIDDNVMRRVPVARIRRTALAHIAEAQRSAAEGDDDPVIITFAGGLAERPPLEEVARLMDEGRTRAEIHALYPNVPLPTIGRWMGKVRKGHKAPDAF